jgi:phosphatidylglycerophosphatase A
VRLIATFFYLGEYTNATISTLFSIPLIFLPHKIIIFSLLLVLGIISSYYVAFKKNHKDPKEVVIDEVLGFFFIFIFVKINFLNIISAFVIFRILDVLKPFPAKSSESLPYGIGIVLDDIIASIYTIWILKFFNL